MSRDEERSELHDYPIAVRKHIDRKSRKLSKKKRGREVAFLLHAALARYVGYPECYIDELREKLNIDEPRRQAQLQQGLVVAS